MKCSLLSRFLLTILLFGAGFRVVAADSPVVTFPDTGLGQNAEPSRDPNAVAAALSWIHQEAPSVADEEANAAAAAFVDYVAAGFEDDYEQLKAGTLPKSKHLSALLRQLCAKMTGPSKQALREELGAKRVVAVAAKLQLSERDSRVALDEMKRSYASTFRRVSEGKVDDEELGNLVSRLNPARKAEASQTSPAKEKPLSALEILSEYSRRNQALGVLAKWRSYILEGTVSLPNGDSQRLRVLKMRPDRFRLEISNHEQVVAIIAFDGVRFWRQVPGGKPAVIEEGLTPDLRNIKEFVDPLFEGEGYGFSRAEDVTVAGKACYQIVVKRPDGTGYAAFIDKDSYRQVQRDNGGGAVGTFGDFRDFSGLTLAAREEASDKTGRKTRLDVQSIVVNPGLVQAAFEMPSANEIDYFALDSVINKSTSGRDGAANHN